MPREREPAVSIPRARSLRLGCQCRTEDSPVPGVVSVTGCADEPCTAVLCVGMYSIGSAREGASHLRLHRPTDAFGGEAWHAAMGPAYLGWNCRDGTVQSIPVVQYCSIVYCTVLYCTCRIVPYPTCHLTFCSHCTLRMTTAVGLNHIIRMYLGLPATVRGRSVLYRSVLDLSIRGHVRAPW